MLTESEKIIYYHYTTIASCHAILTYRKFWLTDYRFLNDKNELRRGLEDFIACFNETEQKALKAAFHWHDFFAHQCTVSLSKSANILSQWRAYANDGTGVAIGFSNLVLKHCGLTVFECVYEEHKAYVERIAIRHKDAVRLIEDARLKCRAENEFMEWIHKNSLLLNSIITDVLALKNPAFAEEQEVRAVKSFAIRGVKHRVRGDLIIPYYEHNFWNEDEDGELISIAIPEIWLGPKCNELNQYAIASFGHSISIKNFDCGYV